MSIFQCENCGCAENTALASTGFKATRNYFDWSYAPHLKGKMLCSACGPTHYNDGQLTKYGVWHRQYKRTFYPLGEFITNGDGNLEHRETGLLAHRFAEEFPLRMEHAARIQGQL
jgi:hypothetical protein